VSPADPTRNQPFSVSQLEAVRRRDPEALGALFDEHFDRLFALVHRMLGNRTAAEDAIQEVFLKIHRGAPTLDPGRDPGPWMTAIAVNVCRDRWRSGAGRLERASSSIEGNPGLGETLTAGTHDPERDLLAAERVAVVREAVQALREPHREVLVLREYEGLGYDQIAEIVGANEAAVRKRYSRALEELGAILKDKGL
jgi:RNA polymerase sigma-70 factor (ECF subfamily)